MPAPGTRRCGCCREEGACCVCWRDGGDCQGSGPFYLSTYVGITQDPNFSISSCYPYATPAGPRATDPTLFVTYLDWAAVQPSLEGAITNPSVISVGGLVDVTLTAADGPIVRKENAFPSFSGAFYPGTPLAFFSSAGTELVTLEFDPPICAVGFSMEPNNASARDDLIIHAWTTDGVTTFDEAENSIGDLLIDASAAACQAGYVAVFARTASRKITKIRFGWDGGGIVGPAVPFAIDDVGLCL